MAKRKTINLVMIVRNEERCLRRCLENVRPHVDRMIVVDTGSTDGTVDIARDCGARIYRFGWIDDFAAARNAGLEKSTADWNLILDADEWIESGFEEFERLRRLQQRYVGMCPIKSWLDTPEGRVLNWSRVSRILPVGVRYRGRIHEQPAAGSISFLRTDLLLMHDGYTYEVAVHKKGRNLRLIEAALQDNPDDVYMLYHRALELGVSDQPREVVIEAYQKVWQATLDNRMYWHTLMSTRLLDDFRKRGAIMEALELAGEIQQVHSTSVPVMRALGELMVEAVGHFPDQGDAFLQTAEMCLKESIRLSNLVSGQDPDLAERAVAARLLMAICRNTGRAAEADTYWQIAQENWDAASPAKPRQEAAELV